MHFALIASAAAFASSRNVQYHGLRDPICSSISGITSLPFSSSSNRRRTLLHQYSRGDYDNSQPDEDESRTMIIKSPATSSLQEDEGKLLWLANSPIVSACFVGLFTGLAVVLFNYLVHEIRDLCWGEIPDRGASWLREEPIETKWRFVILIPVFGGVIVSLLNMTRDAIQDSADGTVLSNAKLALEPILKTIAACVTLGTGNSLGPEGPSVDIGVSVAKGVGKILDRRAKRKLSLRASGSAAGISSGFNAAVAGCFFAVESVLWPSPSESSLSLTNATSMVILSSVIASVISEIGLGSQPAFAVPVYDFRSPSELPLYLLLGILCGLVSVVFSKLTSLLLDLFNGVQRSVGIPKVTLPVVGGLVVGIMALPYPEILYWGFSNVDTLLESRPWSNSLSADLLLQLLAAKILATSICRASGLVGGYYAPSLFIGAATGMAYGKIVGHLISESSPIFHLSFLEVASPQAYGLVGMAATLAGVCQVPLTAVLLLFELTQDYRILLPLLGAVGFAALITSDKTKMKRAIDNSRESKDGNAISSSAPEKYSSSTGEYRRNICELESSLCQSDDSGDDTENVADAILVSVAMRTQYVTTQMSNSLIDVLSLMLEEKQSSALIIDDSNRLIGQLTLNHIEQFIELSRGKGWSPQVLSVSEVCSCGGEKCFVSWKVTPNTDLLTALNMMNRHGISQLPVVLEGEDNQGSPVGVLDRESIDLACRAYAVQQQLAFYRCDDAH